MQIPKFDSEPPRAGPGAFLAQQRADALTLRFRRWILRAGDMNQVILMAHVFFGVACLLAAVWVFVDVLHASTSNQGRIRKMSLAAAAVMWLAFLIGGYWYVAFYKADKGLILKGPWPFAHNFFMETKEHLVILLLLLATYLPIAAANNLAANRDARRVVLWVSGMMAVLALLMEGDGAVIAMGVKVALLSK